MKQTMNYWRTVAGCLPFLMASCADNNPLMQETNPNEQTHVRFAVDDFEAAGASRTTLYQENDTYKVKWASGDAVGIFPYEGYQQPFVIPADQIDQSHANFDGGYWELKEGLTYNAYYPFSDKNFFAANSEGELNIPVSYEGQAQNGSDYGVGAYDYTYSDWQTAPQTGGVTFNFHHIGSLVIVHLTYPATAEFKSLALCTGSEELIPLKGTYDLTANKDVPLPEGQTYIKIPFVADEDSKSSTLTLTLTNCNGTQGEVGTFYLMVPPMDLSAAATMSFQLTDASDKVYDMKVTPTLFESGKKYELDAELPKVFSVSAEKQVIFSPGNLQYHAANNVWRFAENQTDYVGAENQNISATYNGWIDLFGWGTGDKPTTSSISSFSYSKFTDWGTNPIGDDAANTWRTLTADEWMYLFCSRNNAADLFALGTVNDINGTILLPDDWTTPADVTFTASTAKGLTWDETSFQYSNSNADNFSHNTYTAEQWSKMEQAGAVFLPISGYRIGTSVSNADEIGVYRSTTGTTGIYFSSGSLQPAYNSMMKHYGCAVRLVRDF